MHFFTHLVIHQKFIGFPLSGILLFHEHRVVRQTKMKTLSFGANIQLRNKEHKYTLYSNLLTNLYRYTLPKKT